MSELQKQLASLVDAAKQREEEARKDATVEVLIKVMSAQYDKAVAYVNILIIGGFASFYAVWGKMYNSLDQFLMPLAGLLMTIAVIIFILWEIYKMIFYSTNLKRWNEITNEKNPKFFLNP